MSLRLRLKVDAKCSVHSRYNPEKDGRPRDSSCPGCESLYSMWLYAGIVQQKAKNGDGLVRQTEPDSVTENTDEFQPTQDQTSGASDGTATTSTPESGEGGAP